MASASHPISVRQKETSARRFVSLAVAAAFAIRLIVVIFTYRDLPDADKFFERFGWEMGWIARALASGHGYSSPYYPWSGPTALEPPLYPALLALIFRIFGIYSLTSAFVSLALNALFSALTCIPIYFSAMYSLGARKARYAAWVWALYPFAIYFSAARTWEYALTGLLFTTCFCMAQRIHHSGSLLHWLGWGTLVGLTALSNTTTLATFPFLLLLALYQARKRGSHWVLQCILACFGVLVVITPWTIRNVRALGVVCPVRDNLWLEIYVDNFGNAPFDDSSPPSAEKRPYPSTDAAEMRKFLSLGEPAYMAEKRALSLADFHLHRHDTFLVLKTLRRILYYWTGYWSFSAKELRDQPTEPPLVFYLASVTFLMMRGAIRLTKHNLSAALPYIILITAFPLAYYITNPLMDYRQAIEPAIIVLALAGAIPWNRNKQQPV